ncbi:MAG: hypothetical protein R3D78_05055 [Paracoccaceae bacterium]
MRAIVMVLVVLALLTGCKPEGSVPLEPVGEARVAAAQAACEKGGGIWSVGAFGGICTRLTRDSGTSCRKAGDCEGLCLARSMTCAPVHPLLGCNDILTETGARATLCVD